MPNPTNNSKVTRRRLLFQLNPLLKFSLLLVFAQHSAYSLAMQIPDEPASQKQAPTNSTAKDSKTEKRINWPLPTLGGKQFWTDFHYYEGWRIQQNAITKHFRLLDGNNIRRAWGEREACLEELHERVPLSKQQEPNHIAPDPPKHIVVLLHGLMRTADSMRGLGDAIEKSDVGEAVCFQYASTRASIGDHAAAFRSFVESLDANASLSFCGHSMGNIVIRHAIGDWRSREDPDMVLGRLRNVVMLGPPNQGASIARHLAGTGLFELVTGKGGMELGADWGELEEKLATPACPFGIIAGHLPEPMNFNPLVKGASDFVVSVDEARLDGAVELLEVPVLHSFLMDNKQCRNATLQFIQSNHF